MKPWWNEAENCADQTGRERDLLLEAIRKAEIKAEMWRPKAVNPSV